MAQVETLNEKPEKMSAIAKLKKSIELADRVSSQNPLLSVLDKPSIHQPSNNSSAVLVVLKYVKERRDYSWDVLLTLRSQHLRFHPGLICLPGGKVDPGEDVVECALREANEEVGLDSSDLEVIGIGPPTMTIPNLYVWPVISILNNESASLRPNPFEVADVFWMPLSKFLETDIHRLASHPWGTMHYFDYHSDSSGHIYTVWGLTARILVLVSALAYQKVPKCETLNSHQFSAEYLQKYFVHVSQLIVLLKSSL